MISPATTILSLLANKIVFPVFAAIIVLSTPAKPEIPDTMMSTSSLLSNASNSDLSFRIFNSQLFLYACLRDL